jgi:hypothetical protein
MEWMSRILVALLSCVPAVVLAAEEVDVSFPAVGDESSKFQTEVLIDGLDNPCGLVLRPRSERDSPQEVLFAESGAGVVRGFPTDRPTLVRQVLTGLKAAEVDELKTHVSAWSLGFVTPTKLAVFGGMKNGGSQVGVFILPAEDEPVAADKPDHEVAIAEEETAEAELAFPSMTFGETAAFLASGIATGPGQVFRAGLAANRIELPQPLLNIADGRELPWPTGVCLSPSTKMQFLLAAFAGEHSKARDSRVVFLIPTTGKVALKLTPGLLDIVGLAYSPAGQLYAIDLAWEDDEAGGVYRLDDARFEGQPACRAVKIAEVARPTSLLFGDNGTLYVSTWRKDGAAQQGAILKITGEF